MKICAIICEFNPFHNGHAHIIRRARELSGCDALVCVMSGQFTQRGEICRTDKFLRAKHAVLCGADAVVELPPSFAVAPAEIFARGGVKLAAKLGDNISLAFGCESGGKKDFLAAAKLLNGESGHFKEILSRGLDGGESFIRAYQKAFVDCGGRAELLSSPNNLLGVEYAKSALRAGVNMELIPVERVGSGFGDGELKGNFSSAKAIRENAADPAVKDNMPECAYIDFIAATDNRARFESMAADMLFMSKKENLKRIYGCSEGLENKLIACSALKDYNSIVEECTNRRYSSSRIKRILCANLLGVYADETESFLNAELPFKVLAVKKRSADNLLPLLNAKTEDSKAAAECCKIAGRAYEIWRHLSAPTAFENVNEKMLLV